MTFDKLVYIFKESLLPFIKDPNYLKGFSYEAKIDPDKSTVEFSVKGEGPFVRDIWEENLQKSIEESKKRADPKECVFKN